MQKSNGAGDAYKLLPGADQRCAGTSALAADIEQIGPILYQLLRMPQQGIATGKPTTGIEGIGRDIDDAHDKGTIKRVYFAFQIEHAGFIIFV